MNCACRAGMHARILAPSLSGPWIEEGRCVLRAFSGACLFGVPLLYTMEMWWLGEQATPAHMLAILAVTIIANFWLATAIGFKRETSLFAGVEQTFDAVAIGALTATAFLLVLNHIDLEQGLQSVLGKIVLQTLPLSLGASIANAIFSPKRDRVSDADDREQRPSSGVWRSLFSDIGATAIGAVFIASSIAPTEEVPTIAARMQFQHLLALIAFSLAVAYLIVFASGFDRAQRNHLFQHPLTETSLSYLVALLVSVGVLVLFEQVSMDDPGGSILTQTLVLGLPATIGGAAGRLAI